MLQTKQIMKRFFKIIAAILLFVLSIYVVIYYWSLSTLEELRELPSSLLTVVIAYLAIQLLKRQIIKTMNWYDWLYYIGLIAILSPLVLVTSTADWLFDLTKYGSHFLLLPPFIEIILLAMKGKESKNDTENPSEESSQATEDKH